MDRHVDHPLEIADKRDGRAGDRITFLDRLALLVYCFEHFIDVLKRHVVSQDVIRDRVDLFAIAASAMEAGEGNTLCAFHKRAVFIEIKKRKQILQRRILRQLKLGFVGQILINHQRIFHVQLFAGVVGDCQILKRRSVGQILADGGDHVLSEFRFIAVHAQICQLKAIAGFSHSGVGDVHLIAHDVFLGVFSFQSLVADDIEVQFGDDAVGRFTFKDKRVVFRLAGRGGADHFIFGGKAFDHRSGRFLWRRRWRILLRR